MISHIEVENFKSLKSISLGDKKLNRINGA